MNGFKFAMNYLLKRAREFKNKMNQKLKEFKSNMLKA